MFGTKDRIELSLEIEIYNDCHHNVLQYLLSNCFVFLFLFQDFFFYVYHFKSLLNLLQYCFCCSWFFGHKPCGVLVP